MSTGYSITLHQFQRLLYYPPFREVIAPLIREWYGFEVRPAGELATVHDGNGNQVTIESVHDVIQADPERQGRIYREAMTLWH